MSTSFLKYVPSLLVPVNLIVHPCKPFSPVSHLPFPLISLILYPEILPAADIGAGVGVGVGIGVEIGVGDGVGDGIGDGIGVGDGDGVGIGVGV